MAVSGVQFFMCGSRGGVQTQILCMWELSNLKSTISDFLNGWSITRIPWTEESGRLQSRGHKESAMTEQLNSNYNEE